jgi:hypothetical protein
MQYQLSPQVTWREMGEETLVYDDATASLHVVQTRCFASLRQQLPVSDERQFDDQQLTALRVELIKSGVLVPMEAG